MTLFAVELVFHPDRDKRLAVRPAHREYLGQLTERGVLRISGPWADETGALLIYAVADREELQAVLDADPYTPAGVVASTTIREWVPVSGAGLSLTS